MHTGACVNLVLPTYLFTSLLLPNCEDPHSVRLYNFICLLEGGPTYNYHAVARTRLFYNLGII